MSCDSIIIMIDVHNTYHKYHSNLRIRQWINTETNQNSFMDNQNEWMCFQSLLAYDDTATDWLCKYTLIVTCFDCCNQINRAYYPRPSHNIPCPLILLGHYRCVSFDINT